MVVKIHDSVPAKRHFLNIVKARLLVLSNSFDRSEEYMMDPFSKLTSTSSYFVEKNMIFFFKKNNKEVQALDLSNGKCPRIGKEFLVNVEGVSDDKIKEILSTNSHSIGDTFEFFKEEVEKAKKEILQEP